MGKTWKNILNKKNCSLKFVYSPWLIELVAEHDLDTNHGKRD